MRNATPNASTVDDIRSIILAEGGVTQESLVELSNQYASACKEANARLRRCQELLRKGHRSEALQLCDQDPPLLELVTGLDFPERARWCEMLRQLELSPPPELLIEIAAEINEAYAIERPLATLMRRHRRLALARTELRPRIDVLRELARLDQNNPVWEEDLRAYETVRHQQIRDMARTAANSRDADLLQSLERELRDAQWLVKPPAALVNQLSSATVKTRSKNARDELVHLEKELTAAHADFDLERGRFARGRWLACAAIAALLPHDPLADLAAPALDWLSEQDEKEAQRQGHAAALAGLEQALDDDASREVLERAYHALLRYDQSVDSVLDNRYQMRMQELELSATRKFRLLAGSSVVALLIATIAIGSYIYQQQRTAEIARHVAQIDAFLKDGKSTDADRYFDRQKTESPDLISEPELQAARGRIDAAQRELAMRDEQFAERLREAEQALTARDLPAVDRALGVAKKLDAAGRGGASVAKIEREAAAIRRSLREERDRLFSDRLDGLSKELERIESDKATGTQPLLESLVDLQKRTEGLLTDVEHVAPELVTTAEVVLQRVRVTRTSKARERDVRAHLEALTKAIGNSERFRVLLQQYSFLDANSRRAREFEQVATRELPVWKKMEQWNAAIADWTARDMGTVTVEVAAALVIEGEKLLAEAPAVTPAANQLKLHLDNLKRFEMRATDGDADPEQLRHRFGHFTVADLHSVLDDRGDRYYLPAPPKKNPSGVVQFEYLKNVLDPTDTGSRSLLPQNTIAHGDAPQSIVANNTLDRLNRLAGANWEESMLATIVELHDSPDLDPILKVGLLLQVIKVASAGSVQTESAFAAYQNALQDPGLDLGASEKWLDPADEDGRALRSKCDKVLQRAESLWEPAKSGLEASIKRLRQPAFDEQYRWVGWLHRSDDGQWECRTVRPFGTRFSGKLLVARVVAPDDSLSVDVAADISGGSVQFDSGAEAAGLLVEGRPVYITERVKKAVE